jgi:hypothetical protein
MGLSYVEVMTPIAWPVAVRLRKQPDAECGLIYTKTINQKRRMQD